MTREKFFQEFALFADMPNSVTKMREMILQLAVQGKLVPQDPDDEPASDLVSRIDSINPKLRKKRDIKNVNVDLIGSLHSIPDSWEWVTLGRIARIVGGGTPKTREPSYWSDDGIPWLTPADLNCLDGKYISRGRRDISEAGLARSSAQMLPAGSVLFSSRAPIGYVAIASNPLATNQGFKSCVPYINESNEYLYYYLLSAAAKINKNATGTTFKEVSGKELSQLAFPLPPLAEQKRSVAKVDELMKLCDELETQQKEKNRASITLNQSCLKALTKPTQKQSSEAWHRVQKHFDMLYDNPKNVTELRKAILQLAVQGKLVPQDPNDEPASILYEKIKKRENELVNEGKVRRNKVHRKKNLNEYSFPDSWMLTCIEECVQLISGQHLKPEQYNFLGDGIPYLTGPAEFGLDSPKPTRWTLYRKAVAKKMDTLLTVKGSGVGKTNIVTNGEIAISRQLMAVRPILLSPLFLRIFLKSVEGKLSRLKTGIAIPGISRVDVNSLDLPLPPLDEQKRIVSKVDELMAIIDQLDNCFSKMTNIEPTLIDTLVDSVVTNHNSIQ